MAKLFKRAVHEPIRRFTDYESPQAHNDPAVVNQPALVQERVHLFVDHVLQQAMVDDTWSFGPLTGHLLESWLLPHPKWQDEHGSYTRKTKDTICKAVMQALSDYQDHLTGADRDEDSITKVAVQAPWEPPAYEGYTAKYTKKPLYDKAVKRLKALQFPLTLYRAVKIPSEADLWQDHVGIFWTDKLENARFYTPAGRTAPGEKFVLRTEVQPHMIDWDSTFNANTESHGNTGTREQEIKLHMGAPVVINGILPPGGTEFEPRQIRIQAKVATKLPPAEGEVLTAWDKVHILAAEDDELADAIISYVQANFQWGAHPELRDRLLAILKKCPATTKTLFRAEEPSEGTSPEDGQRGFRSWTVNHDTAVYLGNHMGPRNFVVRTTGGAPVKGLSINDFHYWHGRIHGYAGSGTAQAEYLVLDSSVPKRVWKTDVRYAKTADDKTKKKRNWRGLQINIEHPAGTTRKGTAADGTRWEREMLFDYGHFKGVEGADGDGLDCYVGRDEDSDLAFVVNQLFEDGTFDEHKVMLGFRDQGTATAAYLAHMPPGWSRFDPVKPMTVAELRHWLGHEDKTMKVAAPPRVSFQSWLKSVGGWDGLKSIFGHDWMDTYYEQAGEHCGDFPAGSAKQKKCWETTARELAEGDLENMLADWQYKYEAHLIFPLKLYRAVALSDADALKTEGIGVYWTDSESHAQAHWGHGRGHVYVICAEVTEDAVDWPNTIIANMAPSTGEDEQEIRLKAGARVKLVGFRKKQFGWGENEPWKPLDAEAVA